MRKIKKRPFRETRKRVGYKFWGRRRIVGGTDHIAGHGLASRYIFKHIHGGRIRLLQLLLSTAPRGHASREIERARKRPARLTPYARYRVGQDPLAGGASLSWRD